MTIKEAVKKYAEQLNNTDSPIREARLLVGLVTGMDMAFILANDDFSISPLAIQRLEGYVKRRASGEPFAYIAEEKEFMGRPFYVNNKVLIPRPDTEMLVNFAVGKETTVLDLCTGSGCIAVSLARLMPWASVTAVDVSADALKVAKINAERHKVNVEFIKKDILKGRINLKKKFMLAVSNPPYIPPKVIDTLETDVKDFEPRLALDGGEDGLVFYRKIVKDAEYFLEEGGRLCLEIGYDQAEAVCDILAEKFENIDVVKDYAGDDRVIVATLKPLKEHDHDGHRLRLRDRFAAEGIDNFQPHEVAELMLYYAVPRKDVNEKAHKLINRFGSISKIFDATKEELIAAGLTEYSATFMKLIPELCRIYRMERWKDKTNLSNTFVAGRYAVDLFVGSTCEEFYVLSMDSAGGLIKCEKISEGTVNETPLYPRLVVESAIRSKAAKVIVAHNHPSGKPSPSWVDIEATKKIKTALENIDITLVDHIVVGGEDFVSMEQRGLI